MKTNRKTSNSRNAEEVEMHVVKILAHELPDGDDKTADQLAEMALARIIKLTNVLKQCRSVLEPMTKQIICPKDNPLRRAVDAIDLVLSYKCPDHSPTCRYA